MSDIEQRDRESAQKKLWGRAKQDRADAETHREAMRAAEGLGFDPDEYRHRACTAELLARALERAAAEITGGTFG